MLVRSKNAKNVKTLKQFCLHFFLPSPLRQFSLRFFLHNLNTFCWYFFFTFKTVFVYSTFFDLGTVLFCTFFSSSDAIPEKQQ